MIQSSADLIRGWQAERAVLESKINDLMTGATALPTQAEIQAAIDNLTEAVIDIEALITDFSRCEPFPITFEPASPRTEPIIRLRFAPGCLAGSEAVTA